MQRLSCAVMVAVAVVLVTSLGAQQPPPNPQAKIETAVAEATRLLEKQEYKVFLEKFVTAADMKLAQGDMSKDSFTAQFVQYLAPLLVKKLQAIRGVNPTLSSDGDRATFRIDPPMTGRQTVSFKRVSGLWYIEN